MKKFFIILPILLTLTTTCLKPVRDNKFDPDNPDKAYLAGYTYDFENASLKDAVVKLLEDSVVYDETVSNDQGFFEFKTIDPGIYKIVAEAGYYQSVEFYPESLPAGFRVDDFEIQFKKIYLDFESESVGTQEPEGFNVKAGNWEITEDPSDFHSAPNVYTGSARNSPGMSLFEKDFDDFLFEGKIKILPGPGSEWKTGFLLRYVDSINHYRLQIFPDELKLVKMENGNIQYLKIINRSLATETWHTFEVEFRGNHIKVLLNHEPLFELDDTTFSHGFIGLWLTSSHRPISVSFDDITITP